MERAAAGGIRQECGRNRRGVFTTGAETGHLPPAYHERPDGAGTAENAGLPADGADSCHVGAGRHPGRFRFTPGLEGRANPRYTTEFIKNGRVCRALPGLPSKTEVRVSKNGTVSIVIPVYNGERYLVQCIESALAQTYENTEIIAVDDGSTDGSPEILARYSDRIRTVRVRHGGLAAAINKGIACMTGEWLAVLDSDDIMYPDAVERMVGAAERLDSSSATRIIPFFDLHLIRSDGGPTGRTAAHCMDNSMDSFEQGVCLFYGFFGNSEVAVIHRSILEESGGFDERFWRGEDIEFNMRLIMVHKYRFHHVPWVTYGYRMHGAQVRMGESERRRMRNDIVETALSGLDGAERARYLRALKKYPQRRAVLLRAYRRAHHCVSSAVRRMRGGAAGQRAEAPAMHRTDPGLWPGARGTLAGAAAAAAPPPAGHTAGTPPARSVLRRITGSLYDRMRTMEIKCPAGMTPDDTWQTLYRLGRYGEALGCIKGSVGKGPGDEAALLKMERTLYRLGRYGEALGCIDRILGINPDNAEAWRRVAQVSCRFCMYRDTVGILRGLTTGGVRRGAARGRAKGRARTREPDHRGGGGGGGGTSHL